jgi:hypothetical protein
MAQDHGYHAHIETNPADRKAGPRIGRLVCSFHDLNCLLRAWTICLTDLLHELLHRGKSVKTIKGPAVFLAQFAGGDTPVALRTLGVA